MIRKIKMALNKFLHDNAIAELRMQNNKETAIDLTYNDILYLSIIEANSGEYTASNIADMLFVSRPAVTQKINELERQGYIYKVQSKTDRRVYKLFIQKEGTNKKYYEIQDRIDKNINEKLCADYSEKEIDTFLEMLAKVGDVILSETKRGVD